MGYTESHCSAAEDGAVTEDEPWQPLLRDALAVLALPPDEQVRANGPGCVACDLSEAFYHAHSFALESARGLSDARRGLLARIDTTTRAMKGPDVECGNDEVLRRSAWQALREMAGEALREFGWQGTRVPHSVETEPGVWRRPLAEGEPSASADRPSE
jgi:hypothetical protein